MKNIKKGFTLIELLVVVVIVATLATIALPQYQRSIEKARATELLVNLKAIADAQRRYAMNNSGEITNDFNELDVEVEGTKSVTGNKTISVSSDKFLYSLMFAKSATPISVYGMNIPKTDDSYHIFFYPNGSSVCNAYTSKSKNVCTALGGKEGCTGPLSPANGLTPVCYSL